MYKKVSTDMNFVSREKEVEKFWEDNQIFQKSMEEREGKSFLARYFADYWKTEGLKVRIVSYHIDFEVDKKEYIQAQQLSDFWQKNDAEKFGREKVLSLEDGIFLLKHILSIFHTENLY